MNVDTYDAKPLHEEVLTVKAFTPRVFDDGSGDWEFAVTRWVEVAPDRFTPATRSENYQDAVAYYKAYDEYVSFKDLREDNPNLTDVSDQYTF